MCQKTYTKNKKTKTKSQTIKLEVCCKTHLKSETKISKSPTSYRNAGQAHGSVNCAKAVGVGVGTGTQELQECWASAWRVYVMQCSCLLVRC